MQLDEIELVQRNQDKGFEYKTGLIITTRPGINIPGENMTRKNLVNFTSFQSEI